MEKTRQNRSALLKGISRILKAGIDGLTELVQITDFYRVTRYDFVPRPDDVFIVTYPRSGTTWMQMILYQLTTDGRMDFDHICQVVPWFERFILMNVMSVEEMDQLPAPRLFKTHLPFYRIPRGRCRYIYVMRDGRDVAVSYYHFYVSHLFFKGDFSDFYENYFLKGKVQFGSWFEHVSGWWAHKDDPNVLFLNYQDLKTDLETELRKIIDFCALDIAGIRIPAILERCGFDFMKAHEEKFDHITALIWEKQYRQHEFLRRGKTGEGAETLSRYHQRLFERSAKACGQENPDVIHLLLNN